MVDEIHLVGFRATWTDPLNDFKTSFGPRYDAYGNFEYGATGRAVGLSSALLQGVAEHLHKNGQSPQNVIDIQSGYDAIDRGGKLSTVDLSH